MTTTPTQPKSKISGLRKAAMLLLTIGDEASAQILRNLPEDEVEVIGREIARIESVDVGLVEEVLEEFCRLALGSEYVAAGGVEHAKKMLMNAFGPDVGKKLSERVMKSLNSEVVSMDVLRKSDPQQLAKLIHREHPQIIALVLAHLTPSQSSDLLASLPADVRSDVAFRMAHLQEISPEFINKIGRVIGSKLRSFGEFSRQSYGGVQAVADVLNRLDPHLAEEILNEIAGADSAVADAIHNLMFVFEDLGVIGKEGMTALLGRIDRKLLPMALKGTGDALKKHFTDCMSQRAAEMLREDMEALGPVKLRDVESAQQQIIAVARQLEAQGILSLRETAADQYVV